MYNDIGGKIMKLAKVLCWIGIIISVILGGSLITATSSYVWTGNAASARVVGIFIMIGGSLLSWIGSFVLYGLGRLIQNTDILTEIAAKADASYENEEN